MDRRSFISDISLTLALACTGCLAACSKTSDGPAPPPTGLSFSIDLSNSIPNIGDSLIKSGVIVVRLASTNDPSSFTAVQSACTHQGTLLGYDTNQGIFVCPLHGSEFSTSGAVVMGPASVNLKKYSISITGSTLTVTG